jgi:hypothetical protein
MSVRWRGPVAGLQERQAVAEGLITVERADREVPGGRSQPADALSLAQASHRRPVLRGGDERDLNQVLGQGAVATGKHTGVPEQARSARGEAVGKLPGMIHRDPAIAHLSLRRKIRGSSRHPASPVDTTMTARVPWKGQHPCAAPRCKREISFMFLGRTRTANPLALSWYASSRRRPPIRRRRYWPFRPYAPRHCEPSS